MEYAAPRWLPGGNLQTIWPALVSRRALTPLPPYRRERWRTPDGDFIDVDRLEPEVAAGAARAAPLLVLFHGLEGSSASHYAQAFGAWAISQGWRYAVPHFRGCSGEINLAPRAYHSGDFEEIDWILARMAAGDPGELGAPGEPGDRGYLGDQGDRGYRGYRGDQGDRGDRGDRGAAGEARGVKPPLLAVGVSLGGNALLRWAQEAGESAARRVRALAAISSPLDLAAGSRAISRGFNRQVYTRMFMNTMKPKALAKLAQHPGLFDEARLRQARDFQTFDDVFTAPLHGFRDAEDYWRRASAAPRMREVRLPTLVLNALNDPFIPAASLPGPAQVSDAVTLWRPSHGGHVGFPLGLPPGDLLGLPERVGRWLAMQLGD